MPGKMTQITARGLPDAEPTEFTAFVVPFNKIFEINRIEINNRVNEDIRVRGWDTFTDTDEVEHSTSAHQIPLFDYPVASQDAIVVDCQDKTKRVLETLVVQAYSATEGAISPDNPVEVYIGGDFPF